MIIFDLDGCLADNRHRRHLVDPTCDPNFSPMAMFFYSETNSLTGKLKTLPEKKYLHKKTNQEFVANWPAYWSACDMDEPILSAITLYISLRSEEFQIWSGRSEKIKEKTDNWLCHQEIYYDEMKMRPEGETCPDEVLFEKWLDKLMGIEEKLDPNRWHDIPNQPRGKYIEMAFSGNPAVIEMWKRRGVPCFQVHI